MNHHLQMVVSGSRYESSLDLLVNVETRAMCYVWAPAAFEEPRPKKGRPKKLKKEPPPRFLPRYLERLCLPCRAKRAKRAQVRNLAHFVDLVAAAMERRGEAADTGEHESLLSIGFCGVLMSGPAVLDSFLVLGLDSFCGR